MTDETDPRSYVEREIDAAGKRLPVDLSSQPGMPLDVQLRSIALAIAQRHCGDTTVKEGNLYQQLKMDDKLDGPLTVGHVVHTALIFERFLWGEWSKGIAGDAMAATIAEMNEVLERDRPPRVDGDDDDPPIRPSAGGAP